MAAIEDDTFREADLEQYLVSDQQKIQEGGLPCILVLNKVDLITSKRKLRNLQAELDDLAKFDHIFHTSLTSGFGVEPLREYLLDQAVVRPWTYDERMICNKSQISS